MKVGLIRGFHSPGASSFRPDKNGQVWWRGGGGETSYAGAKVTPTLNSLSRLYHRADLRRVKHEAAHDKPALSPKHRLDTDWGRGL